jgi:hypothetical protein
MKSSVLCLLFVCSVVLQAQPPAPPPTPSTGIQATTALFDTKTPQNGLFPSDVFTTPDSSQKTGERVSLPKSVPLYALLNQLDGFSVNPRVTVCFSGAVRPETVQANILIYPAGSSSGAIAINQVIFDPTEQQPSLLLAPGNCVYAKPDQPLAEGSQYLLVVTNGILDSAGRNVAAASSYTSCINGKGNNYCGSLAQAVKKTKPAGNVIGASLFTTMSATAWLSSAKKFVDSSQLPLVLPAGLQSVFSISSLSSLTWVPDTGAGPGAPQSIPLSSLSNVDKVAFGLYLSPNFIGSDGTIAAQPTNNPVSGPVPITTIIPGVPVPGYLPVSFHVFLPPQSAVKGNRIPVVIYGHGLGDSQFGAPTYIADTLAKSGFATLAIEVPGHGFGPLGSVQVKTQQNATYLELTPGRGLPVNGVPIGPYDGCIVPQSVAVRDCARQAAVDLMALVRTIINTNGLGFNLDPNQIYYVGQSFGVTYGTLLNAVEPEIKAAVLNSGGGTSVDVARLAIPERQLATAYLTTVNPALLNVELKQAPPEPYFFDAFNDNYVFRGLPAVTNNVPGAIPIQNAFESIDWLGMSGDPLGFAAKLKTTANPILVQFSYGDLEVPNPAESALIRAAGLINSSWFFHFEGALAAAPTLAGITMPLLPGVNFPITPHRILSNPTLAQPESPLLPGAIVAENVIAGALQHQVVDFFNSGNPNLTDPNSYLAAPFSTPLFQPASTLQQLPEQLNFLQFPAQPPAQQ